MARSYRGAGTIRWGAQDGKDGVNYLIMGWWSERVHYKLTDAGIPVVKVEDTSPDKFSVYKLTALQSTLGIFVASEWEKVRSADFVYMQEAYIEHLQAELITAEKIVALDIVHPSGLYSLIGGKLKVQDAEISGRISIPFVYKEASEIDGTILDFGDTFNLMVSSNYPHTTTIYLPKEQKYNGTECRIFNSGILDIKVGLVGGMYFEGVGTADLPSIYTIPGRHMGIFIAVGAFKSGVVWVCTNPERLIPSYPVE